MLNCKINIYCCLLIEMEQGADIRIVYVPSHLYHMLFELFKNSMRAVMEYHGTGGHDVPPIKVRIVKGQEDICVKVRYKFCCFDHSTLIKYDIYSYFVRFRTKEEEFQDHKQISYLNICIPRRHNHCTRIQILFL